MKKNSRLFIYDMELLTIMVKAFDITALEHNNRQFLKILAFEEQQTYRFFYIWFSVQRYMITCQTLKTLPRDYVSNSFLIKLNFNNYNKLYQFESNIRFAKYCNVEIDAELKKNFLKKDKFLELEFCTKGLEYDKSHQGLNKKLDSFYNILSQKEVILRDRDYGLSYVIKKIVTRYDSAKNILIKLIDRETFITELSCIYQDKKLGISSTPTYGVLSWC
jgi:hypothetical protein